MMPCMTPHDLTGPLARLRASRPPAAATTCLRWCRPRTAEAPSIGQTDVMTEPVGRNRRIAQTLIRNACVNDGHVASGQEIRNADVLTTYLEGAGVEVQQYHAAPGRTSLVARIEGTDPDARVCVSTATPTSYRSTPTAGTRTRSAARSSTARSGGVAQWTCST